MLVPYSDSDTDSDDMDRFIEHLVSSAEKAKNSVFESLRRPFLGARKKIPIQNREEKVVKKDVISVDDDDDRVDELVVVDEDEIEVVEVKTEEEDVLEMIFAHLTDEEKNEVDLALSPQYSQEVLVSYEDIQITGEVLQCLRPLRWLNDEVITVYLGLLKERERREPEKFLKCHFFNPFFYQQLAGGVMEYDYKAVKRWTMEKKIGYELIECDKIFVPIHQKNKMHWCLGVINKKEEKFQYLDSLRGVDTNVLNVLARYYVEEVKDKSGVDIDVSSWKFEFVEDHPVQKNGCDCGMFVLKYIDFYSRGLGLLFNQEHIVYFRRRTAKEILRLRAD